MIREDDLAVRSLQKCLDDQKNWILHFSAPPGCSNEEWSKMCTYEPKWFQRQLYRAYEAKNMTINPKEHKRMIRFIDHVTGAVILPDDWTGKLPVIDDCYSAARVQYTVVEVADSDVDGVTSVRLHACPADPEFTTKDSGSRRTFATGSVRDAATGKGRFDLISPIALFRDAKLYERGAIKYEVRNWEKGQPMSETLDCAMRHLQKHLMGFRDEDHLAAARWNIAALMHYEHQIERGFLPAELDDLPNYLTEEERRDG